MQFYTRLKRHILCKESHKHVMSNILQFLGFVRGFLYFILYLQWLFLIQGYVSLTG